jgi:hypothetical protein
MLVMELRAYTFMTTPTATETPPATSALGPLLHTVGRAMRQWARIRPTYWYRAVFTYTLGRPPEQPSRGPYYDEGCIAGHLLG